MSTNPQRDIKELQNKIKHLKLSSMQEQVDDFLGLDFGFLKDKAIPFSTRLAAVKKASSKVFGVTDKITPLLNETNSIKGVLQSATNNNSVDIPSSAQKDHSDVVSALKNVGDKVTGTETGLKLTAQHAQRLRDLTDTDSEVDENSFNWGGVHQTVIDIAGTIHK